MVGRFTEGRQMPDWHSMCLGRRTLPRDLSAFEIEAFFNFSDAERRVIEDRRGPALKLALALQIGFLRMTGRLLEAVRIVPPALWRHLGEQLGVAAPDLASLRSMYQRRRSLFEHQEVACETLGFHWLSDAQRRAVGRVLRGELARTSDRQRLLQFARRWLYEHRLIVLRDRDLRTMIIKAIREHEAGGPPAQSRKGWPRRCWHSGERLWRNRTRAVPQCRAALGKRRPSIPRDRSRKYLSGSSCCRGLVWVGICRR